MNRWQASNDKSKEEQYKASLDDIKEEVALAKTKTRSSAWQLLGWLHDYLADWPMPEPMDEIGGERPQEDHQLLTVEEMNPR